MRGLRKPAISTGTRPKHPTKHGSVASTFRDGFANANVNVSRKLLVATELVAAVSAKIGLEEGDLLKVVETFKGKDLVGIK